MRVPPAQRSHAAHAHVWHRALSRRQFMGAAAGASGLALTSPLWMPTLVAAGLRGAEPNPIPGGTETPFGFLHFFFPGHNNEPSTITDFAGAIGLADLEGTGVGFDAGSGDATELVWGADLRFMRGKFIGMDGQLHRGAFGFI